MSSSIMFLLVMYLGLLLGGISVRYGLYATVIHELGHIIVYILLLRKIPPLSAGMIGLSIEQPQLRRGSSIVLLASRIGANLLTAGIFWICSIYSPSYDWYFMVVSNLAIAAFNAFPLPFSDGGRILAIATPARYLYIIDHIYAVSIAVVCAGLLWLVLFSESPVLQISLIGVIITIIVKMLKKDRN